MRLRPRECFNHFHLIILAGLVCVALALIVIGGAISAWCIRYGHTFECHSLLHCERAFSCAFKLLPAGIIFCLLLSLFNFIILIIGQVKIEYSGIAKKEYQLVARWVNILALSLAIVLIMAVLFHWFHPPAYASEPIWIGLVSYKTGPNGTITTGGMRYVTIPRDHPSYLKVLGINRQPVSNYRASMNHGPNLFFAAFVIVFLALLGFATGHRLST